MKFKHKLISAAFAAASLLGTSSAFATVVGGVDFGSFGFHIDTTTLAETFTSGDGQSVTGYGIVNTVNQNSNYSTNGTNLYFVFNYTTQDFTGTSVNLVNGTVDIYQGSLGNLLNQSSLANLADIQGLTPWVQLLGHGNLGGGAPANAEVVAKGTFTGQSLSFSGAGLLDVNTDGSFGNAAVAAFLNGNSLMDAFGNPVDVAFTTSGNNAILNPFDVSSGNANGCQNGTAAVGAFCYQGSADLRGGTNAVPEPGSLALLGLGLLSLLAVGKRRKSS